MVTNLRREVIAHLWAHRHETRIRHAVTTRISEEWPDAASQAYENQLLTLLDYLKGNGHWGGEETLIAIMGMCSVSIEVYYEGGMLQTFAPAAGIPTRALRILYSYRLAPEPYMTTTTVLRVSRQSQQWAAMR